MFTAWIDVTAAVLPGLKFNLSHPTNDLSTFPWGQWRWLLMCSDVLKKTSQAVHKHMEFFIAHWWQQLSMERWKCTQKNIFVERRVILSLCLNGSCLLRQTSLTPHRQITLLTCQIEWNCRWKPLMGINLWWAMNEMKPSFHRAVFVHINHSGKANEGEHVLCGWLKCDVNTKESLFRLYVPAHFTDLIK